MRLPAGTTLLTWGKVDFKAGLLRLKAADVKEKADRRTVITWTLRNILQEIQREQTKTFGIPKKNDFQSFPAQGPG